ncbi:hypothetical protein ACWIDS_03240 [Dietzia maris]
MLAGVDDDVRRLLAELDVEDLAPGLVRKLDPATDMRPVDLD